MKNIPQKVGTKIKAPLFTKVIEDTYYEGKNIYKKYSKLYL